MDKSKPVDLEPLALEPQIPALHLLAFMRTCSRLVHHRTPCTAPMRAASALTASTSRVPNCPTCQENSDAERGKHKNLATSAVVNKSLISSGKEYGGNDARENQNYMSRILPSHSFHLTASSEPGLPILRVVPA